MNNYFFYKLLLIFLFSSLESGRTIPFKDDDQAEELKIGLKKPKKTIKKQQQDKKETRNAKQRAKKKIEIFFKNKKRKKQKKLIEKKKRIKILTPIHVAFFYDPKDISFNIDSAENVKILKETDLKSVSISSGEKETNEFVDVQKK